MRDCQSFKKKRMKNVCDHLHPFISIYTALAVLYMHLYVVFCNLNIVCHTILENMILALRFLLQNIEWEKMFILMVLIIENVLFVT